MLTLPFGDLDVSAAVRNDRTRLDQAVARSAEVMRVLRLPSRPAVSPASDLLSPEALQTVAPDTVVLLGDSAFDFPPTTPNSVVKMLGHKVLVTSTAAESGGPGPTAATDPLAMRQRLLSEAALRALDDDSAPLILTLPTVWRGEDAAAFFDELEQPWLDIVPVEEIADDRNAVGQPASTLNYTTEDQEAEIGAGNFTAATRATNAANLLEQVLLPPDHDRGPGARRGARDALRAAPHPAGRGAEGRRPPGGGRCRTTSARSRSRRPRR